MIESKFEFTCTVVVIDYESASLSAATSLCAEELDWLYFLFKIHMYIFVVDPLSNT